MVALASAFVRIRPSADKTEFRKTGEQLGDEAGKGAGQKFGDGFYRDASGRLRTANGRFATDAEKAAFEGGGKAGSAFSSSFTKGSSGLAGSIKSNLKLAAGVFVPLGLAGAVGEIGKIGIAYENNLNIFKTVSGATATQMGIVAEKARQLGADVQLPGVSAAGAAEAMTELAKAGFTVQQSMDAAKATLQLARVANISEGQAAEIAGNAVNAFGIKASEVTGVVDELAATANTSSVEIGDVSNAFKQAASTFAGFQGPAVGSKEAITELNTAIAILGNNGIKGSDAGTSLKQTLLQLTGPSMRAKNLMHLLAVEAAGATVPLDATKVALNGSNKEFYKMIGAIDKANPKFADIGDIAFDSSGKMRSLRDILALLSKATSGYTQEEKDATIVQLFGADASRTVLALLKGGLPVYDKARAGVLQQGAAAKVAAAQNAGLGGAIDNVKSQFENAAISIYNQVKGPLTTGLNQAANALAPLATGITNFGEFVGRHTGTVKLLAQAVGVLTAAFVLYRTTLIITATAQKALAAGQAVIAFIQLAAGVRSAAEAFALLDLAMDANPIGVVVVAIGALVAGFIYAYKHSETFRNIVQAALHGVETAGLAVAHFFTGVVWPALVTAFHAVETAALFLWHNVIDPVWHGIEATVRVVVAVVKGIIAGFVGAYHGVEAAALFLWHNVIEPVWHGIQAVISVVIGIIKGYLAVLRFEFHLVETVVLFLYHNVFQPVFAAITKVVQIWWLAVQVVFKAFYLLVRSAIIGTIDGLKIAWNAVWSFLVFAVKTWWAGVQFVFGLFRTYVYGPIVTALNAVKNFFVNTFNLVAAAVSNWYHAHIVPIFQAVRAAFDAVGQFFIGVYNTRIKPLFSAFVTFIRVYFVNNFLLGIQTVRGIWDGIVGFFSNVYNTRIKPIFNAFIGFIRNNVVGGFQSGVNSIKTAWEKVQEYARKPVAFVVNHVINPFIGGLNKAASIVGVKDRVEPIKGFRSGGKISGSGGITDNRQAVIPGVGAVQLQGGEFVVNRQDTAKALPLLRWVNAGMAGGPSEAARYIGRPVADMPGDGSEGWAFKDGGLVGWADNIWSAVSNPGATIKKEFSAALAKVPGAGLIKDFLLGSARKVINGAIDWVTGISNGTTAVGGTIGGGAGMAIAQAFLRHQNGKPYIWASAGPDGYDCSGIVSAVYNIMHGRNPYSHTFSTESAAPYFPKQGFGGPLVAGWSHPGQAPAGASVGHMMGQLGGLTFESTGSRGVHLGPTTRRVTDFAHVGHYLSGGKVPVFDSGGTLARGFNTVYNGTGGPEPLVPAGSGGDVHFHFHDSVVVNEKNAEDLVVAGFKRAKAHRRIP